MKILKSNTRRRKCFSLLTIVLISLMVPLILASFICYGHSWQNQAMIDKDPPRAYSREDYISHYVFKKSTHAPNWQYHYGVHDWIADSALRIIRLDPLIPKKYTNWILDDFIPYGEFDDYPNYGQAEITKSRGWYSVHTKYGSNGDDKNWMRNRRYVRFLHGTGFPGWKSNTIQIYANPIPFEAATHSASWMYSKWSHNFRFKSDGSIDFSHTYAGGFAIQAAESAIHWFNYKKTFIYLNEEYQIKGKWEMGAQCLGGMTHFIADVSHPFHTYNSGYDHEYWDKIGDILAGWNDQGGFTMKGGPDWSEVNPSLYSIALIPIDPWSCVKEMATFAYDYNGDNYAVNLPEKATPNNPNYYTKYVPWVKNLLNKAVWYTACAMLWIFLQCDFPDDTFSDRWENGGPPTPAYDSMKGLYRAEIFHPQDIKIIKQTIDTVEEGRAEWYNPGISGLGLAYLSYFAPLVAVSLIALIPPIIIYFVEIWKEIYA